MSPNEEAPILRYYAQLERLRDALEAAGHDSLAKRLLDAERTAATSGEAIANTGVVLRELVRNPLVRTAGLKRAVKEARASGRAMWRASGR